jgi:hypothetical protein
MCPVDDVVAVEVTCSEELVSLFTGPECWVIQNYQHSISDTPVLLTPWRQ